MRFWGPDFRGARFVWTSAQFGPVTVMREGFTDPLAGGRGARARRPQGSRAWGPGWSGGCKPARAAPVAAEATGKKWE